MPENHKVEFIAEIPGTTIEEKTSLMNGIKESVLKTKTRQAANILKLPPSTSRETSRTNFLIQSFLKTTLETYHVSPKEAAQILWCVTNHGDSYSINSGQLFHRYFDAHNNSDTLQKVDKKEWLSGMDNIINPDLYAGSQFTQSIIGLITKYESLHYELNKVGKNITLDRITPVT